MKGILFVEDMFKMVLAGVKTETRRIATTDYHFELIDFDGKEALLYHLKNGNWAFLKPKYKAGEIVYLKEPYCFNGDSIIYKYLDRNTFPNHYYKNKMFMPEKYSRFKIQIISVFIEELNKISNQSAINEGIAELLQNSSQLAKNGRLFRDYSIKKESIMDGVKAVKSFETLWNSNNKDVPFKCNPFVWVYLFRVLN